MPSAGTASIGTTSLSRAGLEFLGHHAVGGQDDGAAGGRRLDHDLARGLGKIVLAERLADILAARGEEGVGHAAADDQRIDLFHEVHQQIELGRDLCAADDGDDRALGIAEALLQRLEFGLHGAAGIGGQEIGEALGRAMGAVRGGEGVVDEDVAIGGELFGEGAVVLLLALVEAGVFQQRDVAGHHGEDRAFDHFRRCSPVMKVTLRPMMSEVARAMGSSDRSGSGPSFGRPK